jgi:hypothetical protein
MLIVGVAPLYSGAQTAKLPAIEDSSLVPKPTIKIESISPPGHCDNQELTFFAPWADHYEILKKRCDTAWIHDNRNINTGWVTQTLKPGVTGMIYKQLDEHGAYQFMVKAYKGNRYRQSETITRQPCIPVEPPK